jgi:hypothetical protein
MGDGHAVVAFLADRRSSEGWVTEAFAVLDDGEPTLLSAEGSGATFVAMARSGSSALVLLIDGRMAMTPTHARTVSLAGGRLELGPDVVVFVGGEAEAHTRGVLGTSTGGSGAFGLIPIATEGGFGMATIRLEAPLRTEEPVRWSPYPNGLDPAPLAATHDTSPVRVVRVRPVDARPDADWGLELGDVDSAGAYVSRGLVATRGRVRSLAMTAAKDGTLWVLYRDDGGTWLERRQCP